MKLPHFFCISLAAVALAACSSHADDEEYRSEPPKFADITVRSLADGGSTVRVGEQFVATAVQSKTGRLLNGSDYVWTITPADSVTHRFKKYAIYDNEPQNPTDTILVKAPGQYEINFTGTYRASGNTTFWTGNYNEKLDNGTRVSYSLNGLLSFDVVVRKTITVVE